MTDDRQTPASFGADLRPSMLPFDPAELTAMRVKPVDFARMCGVSKQAVSRWIKEGKISLGPDGKLDPAVASRQVIRNTDPGRLRAKVFKHATASLGDLRARVKTLEAQLEARAVEAAAVAKATEFRHQDAIAECLAALSKLIASEIGPEIAFAVDRLADRVFYPGVEVPEDEDED